jgi:hypothetical protein
LITWASKSAAKAVAQLKGALAGVEQKKAVWCIHPRRGRVDFAQGLPQITHVIALIEVMQRIDLPADEAQFPLQLKNVPITYISVNDFLNLANELRTVPEIMEYLNARRSLPAAERRVIGDEKTLFSFYLLKSASFDGYPGPAGTAEFVSKSHARLNQLRAEKIESARYSKLLEHVAHQLATRHPDCATELPSDLRQLMDDPSERKNYLEMQAVLANLRLRERDELGRAFYGAIKRLQGSSDGFTYMAAHLDARPEWVFVFGASENVPRAEAIRRSLTLMRGAMAHYEKRQCMSVIDRQGEGYEVAIVRSTAEPTEEERAEGKELFGRLRMIDRDCAWP